MKKKLIGLVTLLFVLVSVFGVIAACDETPATYTVTFKNGNDTIKTITVKEGESLTEADIPTVSAPEGKEFDGWFIGETKVEAGYAPTADVTAEAKFSDAVIPTVEYTVTFKNGDEVVSTVTVEENSVLTAKDIPSVTAPTGKKFDGWYVGESKVEAGYVVTDNITVEAKFVDDIVTVTFVVNDEVVATVTVNRGETLANAMGLPSDPTPDNLYTFDGWFNGEIELDESAPVTGDVTYTAKFTKVAVWTVTFVDGSETAKFVELAQSNAVLATSDIPAQAAVSGKVALGWYTSDGVKAAAGLAITGDTVFASAYVGAGDYSGAWLDSEAHKMVIFGANSTVILNGVSYGYTYDGIEGTANISIGSGYSTQKWTLSIIGNVLTVAHGAYDEYEEWEETSYTVTKCAAVDYAGTYRNGQYIITVEDGGAISALFTGNQGGGIYRYAVLSNSGEGFQIEYYASSYATELTVIDVTLENGVIVVDGASSTYDGWYVKSTECVTYSFYESGVGFYRLYAYTTESSIVYVYSTPSEINLADVDGTIEEDAVITIKVNGQDDVVVKISGTSFVFASEEAGTYTLAGGDDLVLDGFGVATIGGNKFEYNYMNGKVVATDLSAGYAIDLDAHTYVVLQKDGHEGTYIYQQETWAKYTVILDGFGNFQHIYNTGSPTIGTYTIDGNTMTVDAGSYGYSYNGAWTLKDGGKILVNATGTSNNGYTYILEGYTPNPDPSADFEGTWIGSGDEEVIIDLKAMTIIYKGQSYVLSNSVSDDVVTFEAKDSRDYYGNDLVHTVTLGDGIITIVHTYYDWDEYGDGFIDSYKVTETYTKKAPEKEDLDIFAGIWEGKSSFANVKFTFDGKGNGTMGDVSFTYTVNGNKATAVINWEDYTFTLNGDTITVDWTYDYEDMPSYTLTKTGSIGDGKEEDNLDALAGTWKFGSWTFEFDGKGKVTINGGTTVDYEFDGTNVSFRYNWEDWTGKLSNDGKTLTLSDEYGEDFGYNHPCTKA